MLTYPKSKKIKLVMPITQVTKQGDSNLKALEGTMTIAKAKSKKIFIDEPLFIDKELNKPSSATKETSVEIFEISDFTTHKEKFYSVSKKMHSICFNQHQIVEFCENHREYIYPQKNSRHGIPIFFLFKPDDDYLMLNPKDQQIVVCVYPLGTDLSISYADLEDKKKGSRDRLVRFVVPVKKK